MLRGLIERVRFALDHRWSPRHMSEYLDGGLTQAGRERIDHHVHDCRPCRALLSSLEATIGSLRRIGAERGAGEGRGVAPEVLAGFRDRVGSGGEDERRGRGH